MNGIKYWNRGLVVVICAWIFIIFSQFSEPFSLIKSNWLFFPMGFGGAVLGNISAVGGGIIFIPAMMFLFHLSPVMSLKVALGSQAFGMTSGAFAWTQNKKLPFGVFKIAIPALIAGSSVSSLLIHPHPLFIKVLFGPVSVALGVLTIVLLQKGKDRSPRTFEEIKQKVTLPLLITAFVGGLITGWIAIGEGELISALLMLAYGMDISVCIGIGVVLLSVNSVFLTLVHHFLLDGMPWSVVIFTGLGCILGARFAVFISKWIHSQTLKKIFALIAVADGLLFIYQYLAK